MDNAEEIMQLLEEFTKMKPKDIPRELDDYLGYVAKTGDPVYQWSLVKCLFREKLLNVITDFYETTPTIDLPPCPNVDPFNYERMKTGLLERLESFPSAPFTVQRICELLTNPRKEYNRADKYMRAIEKNILVVSTREPGTGKRQDVENNQTDAVLNGIPDTRADVEDGLNSPLFGTPPASNEVIVSTCSENEEIEISEPSIVVDDHEKPWLKNKHLPNPSLQDSPLIFKTNTEDNICQKEEKELGDLESSVNNEENSEALLENVNDIIPSEVSVNQIILKEEDSEQIPKNEKDEVLSTSEKITTSDSLSQVSNSTNLEINSDVNVNLESEESIITADLVAQVTSSSEDETKETVSISEVNSSFAVEEVELEQDPKNVTIESPESPPPIENLDEAVTPDEQLDSEDTDPDSSTSSDLTPDVKIVSLEDEKDNTCEEEETGESECIIGSEETPEPPLTSEDEKNDSLNLSEENNILDVIPTVTLPSESTSDKNLTVETESLKQEDEVAETVSSSVDETPNTDNLNNVNAIVIENNATADNDENKVGLVESTNDVCEHDRKEGSIIHSTPNLVDVDPILAMEEVCVDQSSCVVEEEEAMDIDESSNQQMVLSEGENEGEPMDQCDQPQS